MGFILQSVITSDGTIKWNGESGISDVYLESESVEADLISELANDLS